MQKSRGLNGCDRPCCHTICERLRPNHGIGQALTCTPTTDTFDQLVNEPVDVLVGGGKQRFMLCANDEISFALHGVPPSIGAAPPITNWPPTSNAVR